MDLLEMLAAVEEGKHTRMENVDMVKVRLSNAFTYSYDHAVQNKSVRVTQ